MKQNKGFWLLLLFFLVVPAAFAEVPPNKAEDKLPWWPTDAQPAPVKDDARGGFWWWPSKPGKVKDLWGNRGYAYVNKIIYDWRGKDSSKNSSVKNVEVNIANVGFVESTDHPSLLVKQTIQTFKFQFKEFSIVIEPEGAAVLKKVAASLKRHKDASVLVCVYDDTTDLAAVRSQAAAALLVGDGILPERIKVLSTEKMVEAGLSFKQPPVKGTLQLTIAQVQEVMIPGPR